MGALEPAREERASMGRTLDWIPSVTEHHGNFSSLYRSGLKKTSFVLLFNKQVIHI